MLLFGAMFESCPWPAGAVTGPLAHASASLDTCISTCSARNLYYIKSTPFQPRLHKFWIFVRTFSYEVRIRTLVCGLISASGGSSLQLNRSDTGAILPGYPSHSMEGSRNPGSPCGTRNTRDGHTKRNLEKEFPTCPTSNLTQAKTPFPRPTQLTEAFSTVSGKTTWPGRPKGRKAVRLLRTTYVLGSSFGARAEHCSIRSWQGGLYTPGSQARGGF
jgi:hypothetical protein